MGFSQNLYKFWLESILIWNLYTELKPDAINRTQNIDYQLIYILFIENALM